MSTPEPGSHRQRGRVKWRGLSAVSIGVVAVLLAGGSSALVASSQGYILASPHDQVIASDYVDPEPTAAPPAGGSSPAPTSPLPDAASLKTAIDAISRGGVGTIGLTVVAGDGTVLVDEGAARPMTPASSNKILTCLTALSYLGADHRFTTKVVDAGARIILVGGGDPYLANTAGFSSQQASAVDLAEQTAVALRAQNRTTVALGYDDTLFSGPDVNPAWPSDYASDVTRVTALSIDQGVVNGVRNASPALLAASTFAGLLTQQGITVSAVTAATAPAGANQLAAVESMPLAAIVHQVLQVSDNSAAEVIFRQIGLAGGGAGSFADAVTAEKTKLGQWGLWGAGMTLVDGSGLSHSDQISPAALAGAVRQAWSDPDLSDVLVGLPVAYSLGTLANRFTDSAAQAARGVVRAKTGTLDGVRTLTGYTQTSTGGVVMFALMVENYTNSNAAMTWLDQVAAAITAA